MAKKILQDEFIGCDVEVTSSNNKANEGIKGTVMDETLHTLKVLSNKNVKTLMKSANIFKIQKNGSSETIRGSEIEFRSEDRIKKVK